PRERAPLPPRDGVVAVPAELVDAAERRLIKRGDELGADAPDVDASALILDVLDQMLVEIVGRDDLGVRKSGRVEHRARLGRQMCEVARVEANAGKLVASCAQ